MVSEWSKLGKILLEQSTSRDKIIQMGEIMDIAMQSGIPEVHVIRALKACGAIE